MKKLNIKYYFPVIYFMVLLVFPSCEKEIDLNLRSVEPNVVIEGTITLNGNAIVNITTTKDFEDNNEFPPLFGAIVKLTDENGNSEILEQSGEGLYIGSSIIGQERTTYHLSVKLNNNEYTASSTLPRKVNITNIVMYHIPLFDYPVPQVIFQDPSGEPNYYRAILSMNGKRMDIGNETIDDRNRDGVMIERILPVFDDNKEDSRKVEQGDIILVELQSLDKGAYTFFDTLGSMGTSLNNPTSNFKGGALGYFSAYASDFMEIVAMW